MEIFRLSGSDQRTVQTDRRSEEGRGREEKRYLEEVHFHCNIYLSFLSCLKVCFLIGLASDLYAEASLSYWNQSENYHIYFIYICLISRLNQKPLLFLIIFDLARQLRVTQKNGR